MFWVISMVSLNSLGVPRKGLSSANSAVHRNVNRKRWWSKHWLQANASLSRLCWGGLQARSCTHALNDAKLPAFVLKFVFYSLVDCRKHGL